MRKNKTWEITLTDNSRLVANEPIENAVVYTTDTEAYLNFRVIDSGFDFDSATIAMLNKDDGSIVERPMTKEVETAVYEIESDIIPHFGLWQAQVLFKQGEEVFTSTPVKFVIERYMGAEQPPRLEDVVSWKRLYDNATETMLELIRINDELTNANEVIQQAEAQRVLAENERSEKYESYAQQFDDVIAELSEEKDYASLPEIASARGGHDTLGQRLDETTAQLVQIEQEKISHGNVQKSDYDLSKDSNLWNINDFDDDTRQALLESQSIDVNYVLGRENVKKENVARNAITENHISFIDIDKKEILFNTEYSYLNVYIAGNIDKGGTLDSGIAGGRTVILEVKPNSTYTISKELSDRFRIATHSSYPEVGERLDRYVKDEFISDEAHDEIFTFDTLANENYLIITLSINSQEPNIQIVEGIEPEYDYDTLTFSKDIESLNIVKSSNIFDGNYIDGGVQGNIEGTPRFQTSEHTLFGEAKSAIIKIAPNTNYTISKTTSSRFRVALHYKYPDSNELVTMIRDEFDTDGGDVGTKFTFNSQDFSYLIIYVTNDNMPPEFLQVEEGTTVTEWETYGFKFTPQSEKHKSVGFAQNRDGKVFVDDFLGEGKNDADAIQEAFDNSHGNIVVFNPEKKYKINKTVTAHASKVRGIEGQNALIETNSDIDVLKYVGSKTSGNAMPGSSGNIDLSYTEMKPFIKNLRVSSTKGAYVGSGIVFDGTFGMTIDGCHLFNLKHGIKVIGWNRDFILSNNNIWHNSGYGVFWDTANVHQQILVGNHISYCKKALYLLNSDMHNLHITGNDIESGSNPASGSPESLIHFHLDAGASGYYEAIHIVGNSLQDHNSNTDPLLYFNSEKTTGIQDLILGNNQLGNSVQDSFHAKGLDRATITGNSVKGNQSAQSINLVGSNRNVAISGNQLTKGVNWSVGTTKTAITGNVTNGFTLPDSNDGKVLVANNI